MTTTKPVQALATRFRCPDPQPQPKRLHGARWKLFGALWKTYRTWKLKREARQLLASFYRVAGELGHHPNCQQHPRFQIAKLDRINSIAAELRRINFPQLGNNSSR